LRSLLPVFAGVSEELTGTSAIFSFSDFNLGILKVLFSEVVALVSTGFTLAWSEAGFSSEVAFLSRLWLFFLN